MRHGLTAQTRKPTRAGAGLSCHCRRGLLRAILVVSGAWERRVGNRWPSMAVPACAAFPRQANRPKRYRSKRPRNKEAPAGRLTRRASRLPGGTANGRDSAQRSTAAARRGADRSAPEVSGCSHPGCFSAALRPRSIRRRMASDSVLPPAQHAPSPRIGESSCP
jgi:hypothetical protein